MLGLDSANGEEQVNKKKKELVLEIGAAGGSLSVWSVTAKDGARSFFVVRDESTLKDFLDKEDGSGITYYSKTGRLNSFTAALVVLDRYPWHRLYPSFVHQDFIDIVYAAVMSRGGEEEANRWRRILERSKNRVMHDNSSSSCLEKKR